jgi:hypothetical protein
VSITILIMRQPPLARTSDMSRLDHSGTTLRTAAQRGPRWPTAAPNTTRYLAAVFSQPARCSRHLVFHAASTRCMRDEVGEFEHRLPPHFPAHVMPGMTNNQITAKNCATAPENPSRNPGANTLSPTQIAALCRSKQRHAVNIFFKP